MYRYSNSLVSIKDQTDKDDVKIPVKELVGELITFNKYLTSEIKAYFEDSNNHPKIIEPIKMIKLILQPFDDSSNEFKHLWINLNGGEGWDLFEAVNISRHIHVMIKTLEKFSTNAIVTRANPSQDSGIDLVIEEDRYKYIIEAYGGKNDGARRKKERDIIKNYYDEEKGFIKTKAEYCIAYLTPDEKEILIEKFDKNKPINVRKWIQLKI